MDGTIPVEMLRADTGGVLLGSLIFFAGAMGCLMFALRPRPRESALLYFGLASCMYGLRLIAQTNLARKGFSEAGAAWDWIIWVVNPTIFIPFTLFFVNTVAPQWKKAAPWMAAAAATEAVLSIAARVMGLGTAADTAYKITVILYLPLLALMLFLPRRPAERQLWVIRAGFLVAFTFAVYTNLVQLHVLPGRSDLEPLGFLFFLCCQGYVAAGNTFRNEQRLVAINKELEIARDIQFGLLPGEKISVRGLEIAATYVPASSVAGDFYYYLAADENGLGVLVADVSGHGVPAAISASMVKVAIHAQTERVHNPAEVLTGLNSILCGNLRGQFVTAAYAYINVSKRQLSYAGAGHPPLLLWCAREAKVHSIEENGLFLGAFPDCEYRTFTSNFEPSDRCLLYTDGVVEAPNTAGHEFGNERLRDFLAANAASPARPFCDALLAQIEQWTGAGRGQLHDDMTVVVVDFKPAGVPETALESIGG